MNQKILTLTLAVFAALSAQAQNRKIEFEQGSVATILAKAKAENKPVFVDAFTTWCGPCKWMDREVFVNDSVADYFNAHFINYKLDMEKGEGPAFAQLHSVSGYPSFVFVDGQNQMLHYSMGARPPGAFLALGREAANPETQLATLDKQYASGKRDPEFVSRYLKVRSASGLPITEVLDVYSKSLTDAQFTARPNWVNIYWRLEDVNSGTYDRFLRLRDSFSKKYTRDSVDSKLAQLHEPRLMRIAAKGNPLDFERMRDDFTKLKLKDNDRILLQAEARLYDKMKDQESYTNTVVKLVDTYYLKDANRLNEYAWAFYEKVEDKSMLKKAESWAAAAVKLSPVYSYLDTHAALLYKLGRKKEAAAAAERAIAAGRKGGDDVSDTETLLQKIKLL